MLRFCTGVLLALLMAAFAPADVHMDIEAGYEGRFRPGRWSPVFVEVWSDPTDAPQTAILSLTVPNASNSVMDITQAIGVGPQKQKYILYAPVAMNYNPLRASLRNAESNALLTEWPPRDKLDEDRGSDQIGLLIVTSGNTPLLRNFTRTDTRGRTIVSHQRQRYLPPAPIGYDSADVLVLNAPDWTTLSFEQQQAIVAWARAGGVVFIQPGIDTVPDNAPLRPHLPADLGELTTWEIPPDVLQRLGLPERFARIGTRTLTLRDGARKIDFNDGLPPIATRSIGLGSISILPFDIGTMQFSDNQVRTRLWGDLFDKVMGAPASTDRNSYYYETDIDAAYAALDVIGDIPNTGSFGFGYIAIVIGALMLIVGPIDWFVLRKLGRQPWTWATTIGWIGLVTVGAIYAGHVMRSGDLHFRTLRLIEQAGDRVIATDDVALVYAPRTADYAIASDPYTWWQPVPSGHRYRGESFTLPLSTHQDYRGSQPMPMQINIWNWRFLHGIAYADKPPIVEASLRIDGGKLAGTITNRADKPLKDLRVRIGGGTYSAIDPAKRRLLGDLAATSGQATETHAVGPGVFTVPGTIAPGATLQVSSALAEPTRETPEVYQYRGGYPTETAGPTPYDRIFKLSSARNDSAERLLQRGHAIVFATMDDPTTDVTIQTPGAAIQHKALVRAVVPFGELK